MIDHSEHAVAIEANIEAVLPALTAWAKHMAARYNGSVYLIGSTLHNPLARDLDIRIVIEDNEFARRYDMAQHQIELGVNHPLRKRHPSLVGANVVRFDEDGVSQRWIDDVAKFTGTLSVRLGRNVDLKVWPASYYRADVWPEPILLAAPSRGWHVYNKYHPKPQSIIDFEAEAALTVATVSPKVSANTAQHPVDGDTIAPAPTTFGARATEWLERCAPGTHAQSMELAAAAKRSVRDSGQLPGTVSVDQMDVVHITIKSTERDGRMCHRADIDGATWGHCGYASYISRGHALTELGKEMQRHELPTTTLTTRHGAEREE